jgi:hypothetical protein
LQAEKQSDRGKKSGHKSGGLVSVLASGPFACPNNARVLTDTNNNWLIFINICVSLYPNKSNKVFKKCLLSYLSTLYSRVYFVRNLLYIYVYNKFPFAPLLALKSNCREVKLYLIQNRFNLTRHNFEF